MLSAAVPFPHATQVLWEVCSVTALAFRREMYVCPLDWGTMTVSTEAASLGAPSSATSERLYRWVEARRSKGTNPPS